MKTIRYLFLIFIFLLVNGYAVAEEPDCDRGCLEKLADRYLKALVAHDPSRAPLSKKVKFTENGQELQVGDALWATASDLPTTYKIYLTDPQTGQVGFSGLMKENGKLILISFRLKLGKGDRITEVEQIVARDNGQFFGGKSLTTPDPIYAEVLKPSERSSREDMVAIADSYFAALERMDGTRPVPFAETCNRMENGMQTTNNPAFGGSGNGYNITALGCIDQFKSGYFKFVTRIRRRHLVIDEERGLVSSTALLDHAGNISSVRLTNGQIIPVSLSSPTSFLGGGFFKIKDGKIHRIHTILITAPYGMKPGW